MSKELDFIKQCGHFFVITLNNDFPAARPFGAIMEHKNDLYISTADFKAVYSQLKHNGHMQIVAIKPGTRSWLRISGIADECENIEIKKEILNKCPVLNNHYNSPESEHFNLFRIKVIKSEFK